jgi:2-iminobutanoate/2-iminopropanoate deaminase
MAKITRGNPENFANIRSNIYNHFVKVENPKAFIFVSGQLSRDKDGNLVGVGDMAAQTRQAIQNIENILGSAGATLDDVVQVVVYTTDMRLFKESCEARMEFFKNSLPTSTTIEVQHLTEPLLMIEIQALAVI